MERKRGSRQPLLFTVGAWGSAIVKNPRHYQLFKERFREKYGNVTVTVANRDAAYGACSIALDILNDCYKNIKNLIAGITFILYNQDR